MTSVPNLPTLQHTEKGVQVLVIIWHLKRSLQQIQPLLYLLS